MIVTVPELRNVVPARSKNLIRAIVLMASMMLLGACDQQNESGRVTVDGSQANMSFTPPTQLLSTRSIVRANLILEITIAGETSRVEPNGDGVYEFKTTRPANSTTTVTLIWSELIDGEPLPLARASKTLNVGSGSNPVEPLRFSSSEFEFASFDLDGDKIDNYTERRNGSDTAFNDPQDPVSPPVFVTIDVRLSLPIDMRDSTVERIAAVTAQALVNSEEILLSRDGNVWTGSATVTQNSEPLVTVTFYATDDRRIKIASLARNQNIGGGGQAIFNEDDYDVDAFNDDGDNFTNIQETAIGSNPRDSSDPRAPVANAGADQTIASGAMAALDGSGSTSDPDGSIATYRWSEGTALLATGISPEVSGLSVGQHLIELLVTDDLGLTDTDTVRVTVTAAPVANKPPIANAGDDQIVTSDDVVTLDGSGSTDVGGTIVTYEWFEGTTLLGEGETLDISDFSVGPHEIKLVVTDDDDATGTDTVMIEVTAAPIVNQPPVANAGDDQIVTSDDVVTLDGSGSTDVGGAIVTYEWFDGMTPLGEGETLDIDDFSVGTHEITLVVTDDDDAMDTDTVMVEVTAAPIANQPPVANAGEDQIVTSDVVVTLDGSGSTDVGGTIVTYEWFDGVTPLGEGETLDIDDFSVGTHGITLVVTDDDDAMDTDIVIVEVTAAADPDLPPMADAGAA